MNLARALLIAAILGLVSTTANRHTTANTPTVNHVIHVSIDGLNATTLQSLIENDGSGAYLNFKRLVDEGSYTFNARTDYDYTNTIPNHTSMLTGRPAAQPNGMADTVHHGYTYNLEPSVTDTLHNKGNPNLPYIASVFDVVHDNGLGTALYASKSKLVIYELSYNSSNGAADIVGEDNRNRQNRPLRQYAHIGRQLYGC